MIPRGMLLVALLTTSFPLSGCYGSHGGDTGRLDAATMATVDAGAPDSGPRELPPGAPIPAGAEELGCHPDTIFIPADAAGCVYRDVEGAELRACDAGDRTVAGQPVTVLNRVAKELRVEIAVLEVACSRAACIAIHMDNPGTCDCGAGGGTSDPWGSMDAEPWTQIVAIVHRFTPSWSAVVGGEGVRFRITVCPAG